MVSRGEESFPWSGFNSNNSVRFQGGVPAIGYKPINYPMVMTNIAMEAMALIEIVGLPKLIALWIFPWQTVNVITRW